jgi:leucyl aminopeptidase
MGEAVVRAAAAARFEGKADATLSLRGLGGFERILLVGVGDRPLTHAALADLGGRAAQETREDAAPVAILADGLATSLADPAAHVALGAGLGQWRYDRYKSEAKAPPTQPLTIVSAQAAAAEAAFRREWAGVVDGARLARDLSSQPSNEKYPESFVAQVRAAFAGVPNVRIEVLDEPAMRRLNMGALLSVGQGSARPSRLLVVEYRGAGTAAPLALVGKGITFDSGGISIKPAAGMWRMRRDMAGAAAAMGGALAVARRAAPVNLVAVAALAENMPDGNAQRPGDVVRTMTGKTIEVLNTDAEGRLVLVDANQYVIDRYKPAAVVNIATLTGSIVQALDDEFTGMFARDEDLARRLQAAADASGEAVWRMPLHPNYARDMASDIADIKNVVEGGGPGASLAAHFLSFLTPEPTPWGHLDIAGTALTSEVRATTPKGPTGVGVRLFNELARGFERR